MRAHFVPFKGESVREMDIEEKWGSLHNKNSCFIEILFCDGIHLKCDLSSLRPDFFSFFSFAN